MTIKIGINGLGRIGRMIIRSLVESKNNNIEIKHINNRTNSETSCLLLKYDSVHGKFNTKINYNKDNLESLIKELAMISPQEVITMKKNSYRTFQQKFSQKSFYNEMDTVVQNL